MACPGLLSLPGGAAGIGILRVFHRMQVDEGVRLDGYAYTTKHGYADNGWELYEEMKDMAHGHGAKPEAEQMFDKMLERGVSPDHVMFISVAKFLPKGWEVLCVESIEGCCQVGL
uniref:Pentatricopeptide repeat-containing protein n=1 Tax=Aegilops tauschii TaxID=37682 RepID=N1R330_AEGTA